VEEARQHPALGGHPDSRTFAADRLLESERMALAAAAGPLALLVTQIGALADAASWIKALATVSFLCLVYCCVWQVHIISYATYWLASERLGPAGGPLPGRGLIRAVRAADRFTEDGLAQLIRRSTLHYSLAYWLGGFAGIATVLAVIWS
jgi:hypothetical protein